MKTFIKDLKNMHFDLTANPNRYTKEELLATINDWYYDFIRGRVEGIGTNGEIDHDNCISQYTVDDLENQIETLRDENQELNKQITLLQDLINRAKVLSS